MRLTVILLSLGLLTAVAGAADDPAAEWKRLAGQYTALYQKGDYAQASTVAAQALAVAEQSVGKDSAQVAQVLNDLGYLASRQGHAEIAVSYHQRALAIRERRTPPEPPALVQSLTNLANDYRALGRLADADPLLARALELLDANLPPNHPSVLNVVADLALLRLSEGQPAQAEPLFKRFEGQVPALGQLDQQKVALVWERYAACLQQLGHPPEAAAMQQRAVSLRALVKAVPTAPAK